ncbi:MAG: twin-arginine translocase subunit TatC [Sphingomonadaceae bacterium]|nr:twin-arginine translocase subunit TatC [Sphingomonadaceae bacterium]
MRDIDDSKAPLLDHLIELRRRLLWCVLAVSVCFVFAYVEADTIFALLIRPFARALEHRGAASGQLIYTKLYEAFFTKIRVALNAAFFLAFPVLANQLWGFVAPGLYRKEKQALLPFLLATPVLFIMGGALAYFVAMPTAIGFFLGFQEQSGNVALNALPAIGDYLSFVLTFIWGFGIAFLLPVLLMLLETAGVVQRKDLVAGRRYAIVAAFAVAAVLTPPDVVSQFTLAIPLMLLYELALFGMLLTGRRRAREASRGGSSLPAPQ